MLELSFIFLLTLALTAYGSFLSASFSEVSHHHLMELAEEGSSPASALLDMKRDSEETRSALFLLDTLFGTLGCVVLGGYAVVVFGNIIAFVVFIGITLALTIFGRMIPRALGRRFAPSSVNFTARCLHVTIFLMKPFVRVVDLFFQWFAPSVREGDEEETVREELRDELDEILETARDDGSLDASEYNRLKNIVRFSDVRVSDVMTPRTVVFSSPCKLTVEEAAKIPELLQYSRFPVYEEDSLDSIVGYVLTKDILWAIVNKQETIKLRELSREVYFIPENIDLDRALENFLERREHLFVVVDEYGGVEGLITMEDVMETLLGVEILDEADKVDDLRELAKQRRDQRIAALRAQNAQVDESSIEDMIEETSDTPMFQSLNDMNENTSEITTSEAA
jgi:CBS domain containing-hemolysin-like protein